MGAGKRAWMQQWRITVYPFI